MPKAKHLRGHHIRHAAELQEFRAHVVAERKPVERRHNQNQKPETAAVNTADENHHVKHRERRPNFDHTLYARIPELSEVALDAADDNAEERPEHGQEQTKADANAEPVNQA